FCSSRSRHTRSKRDCSSDVCSSDLELDKKIKDTVHLNVSFPLFIPESLLQKEKDHVEGFAPEVAWVTQGGDTELGERVVVRPTSEVLFCEYYSKHINSYRDLPKLYNQWSNV